MMKIMKNLKVEYYEDALITHHNLSISGRILKLAYDKQMVVTGTFAHE